MSAVATVLGRLSPVARSALAERLAAARRERKFETMFPAEGPLARSNYPGAMKFFAAGRTYLERALLGGNRSGKTTACSFELTCHLLGDYPAWWEGRRFTRPITAWCVADDSKSAREACQAALMGDVGAFGCGMLPKSAILSTTRRAGVPDAIDTVLIRHASGGQSRLTFKSSDSGRESFQGAAVDVCWADEEPPEGVYTEALMRLMATRPGEQSGLMMMACTPLRGLSSVILRYLPGGKPVEGHSRFAVLVPWSDVPHLGSEEKSRLEAALAPHEVEARTKGVPSLGSGAIFPVPEGEIVVRPFRFPAWYRRAFALDVGWRKTACLWCAHNFEEDCVYLVSEHYQSHAEPAVHAQGILARGRWIPGVVDPAARGRSQHDGEQLLALYKKLGLQLTVADNAVEAGIYQVWERMSSGRLKVFDTLQNWLTEFRVYRRDQNGKPVKENDHLMDCTRYLIMSGLARACSKPFALLEDRDLPRGLRRPKYTSHYDPLRYGDDK